MKFGKPSDFRFWILQLSQIRLYQNYSSVSSPPLRSLRPLWLNHSDTTGIDNNQPSTFKSKAEINRPLKSQLILRSS